MSREQSKAAQYIQRLNEARCQGNWDAVPELVRKIKKHAPGRICLALTAEAEHAVARNAENRPSTARVSPARPSTATTISAQSASISSYIPLLLESIHAEHTYVEDEFQAQVCLGWIHWQLGEPALAAERLPKRIEQDFSQLDDTNKESAEWTRVCAIKGSYIKGSSQRKTGLMTDALETFESALPIISNFSSRLPPGKEQWIWTELYLTELCMLSSLAIKPKISSILDTETLTAFRAWAKFWEMKFPRPPGGRAPQIEVPRRQVWKEYYITLSDILHQGLPYPTTTLATAYAETSTRLQQREELKRVEAIYETLLLSEVQFPKAEEASDEVEAFVEIVMQNWRILCGSRWQELDLGEGGAEAVSRGVLDILYRAATKTFHSTPVLRYLFTVHLAVAEFDLAFKAFDTYLEIVKKGKARVEKTGEEARGLDDDETVLKIVSRCIKALCQYGSLRGAEKARDICQYFEGWLDEHHPINQQSETGAPLENGNATEAGANVSPRTIAMLWSCIGIGHARWARLTFEASTRADTQMRAIKCFRKSLLPQYESTTNVETLFALGTILAERRELGAAIDVVKCGLLPSSSSVLAEGLETHPGKFVNERSRIPLWHLMALLLSARQEFITAARSCEATFEQFQDPKNLFGEEVLSFCSEHLKDKASPQFRGVVDDMDDFEKENVLEVKMTQLALIEVLEGPEVAVNASDELLSLYTRLFGNPQKDFILVSKTATTLTAPPKSSAGTLRSIKGSIFGRSGRSIRKSNPMGSAIEEKSMAHRPQTTQTVASITAPTIQVTNENGSTARQHRYSKDHVPHHEKLQKRSNSVSNTKRVRSVRRRSLSAPRVRTSISPSHSPTTVDGEKYFTPLADTQHRDKWLSDDQQANRVGIAVSPDISSDERPSRHVSPPKPLPPKIQQMAHKEPVLKPLHPDPTLARDNRVPQVSPYSSSTSPATRFPKDQERRRRTSILVKVWLLVSGFYRRASMYDDAIGAVEEAQKLVQHLEMDVSRGSADKASIDHAGWGGFKSVGELWGDVYSERGFLAVAESQPYSALAHFESALTRFADHPSAIVGLSNILLDIYSENLLPPTPIPKLILPGQLSNPSASTLNASSVSTTPVTTHPSTTKQSSSVPTTLHGPLGLATLKHDSTSTNKRPLHTSSPPPLVPSNLTTTRKESSTALLDRLAARDRAYGLLSGLTKLGSGWNYSEAWFALARAYEEGGQLDKVREVLWWCVELEEGRAVRDWSVAGGGAYAL